MPRGGGDVGPEAPLCSMESDSAPRSVTLGTGWAGVPLLVRKGVLWHTEPALFGRLYPREQTGLPLAGRRAMLLVCWD